MGLLRIAPKVLESRRKTEHVILSFANGIYLRCCLALLEATTLFHPSYLSMVPTRCLST